MINVNVDQEWSKDIMETEESEIEEADVIKYSITHYPADYTLGTYLDKSQSGQLIIPEFQRNFIWGIVQASKLMESFLLGLPVPAVFLYKQKNTNKLLVLDGQQRIFSAVRFLKNEFGERIFRLKGVDERWEGKTFEELNEADKFQLLDAVLRAVVVQQLSSDDDTSIYQIFERLNTGGVNLNAMEVRKCVYLGEFMNLLIEMNKDSNWRRLIGKPEIDTRFRDVEFILRILAFRDNYEKYEKPMKHFLNKYMAGINKKEDGKLAGFNKTTREEFKLVCKDLFDMIGEKPFHLRGRLNYAVMDSTMYCVFLAVKAQGKITDFRERFKRMMGDELYIESVTYNTSDEREVKQRGCVP